MKKILLLVTILIGTSAFAQRAHEIQLQTGLYRNWGVSFFDYYDPSGNRHNYEWDQIYNAEFYTFSWRYPVNAYLEFGLFFSSSFEGMLTLFEAESAVFNDTEGNYLRPDTLFVGLNELESKFREFGFDIRTNISRGKKIKSYTLVSVSLQRFKNLLDKELTLQVQDDQLKEALLDEYLITEKKIAIGLGAGIYYPLKHGLNIRILELYGKYLPGLSTNLSSGISFELRTGLSYRFYRKK